MLSMNIITIQQWLQSIDLLSDNGSLSNRVESTPLEVEDLGILATARMMIAALQADKPPIDPIIGRGTVKFDINLALQNTST